MNTLNKDRDKKELKHCRKHDQEILPALANTNPSYTVATYKNTSFTASQETQTESIDSKLFIYQTFVSGESHTHTSYPSFLPHVSFGHLLFSSCHDIISNPGNPLKLKGPRKWGNGSGMLGEKSFPTTEISLSRGEELTKQLCLKQHEVNSP